MELVDLREWVFHYVHRLGTGKIYVYDDESSPVNLTVACADYIEDGVVEVIPFVASRDAPGSNPQNGAYKLCLDRARGKHEFAALFDWDEFLWLTTPWQNQPLRKFLEQFEREGVGALGVNWIFFTSSGLIWRPPKGVRKSYSVCIKDHNNHVKSIVRPAFATSPITVGHVCGLLPGYITVNELYHQVEGPFSDVYSVSNISLAHYASKSKQDYNFKCLRGAGDRTRKDWIFFQILEKESVDEGEICTQLQAAT
eukprot:TRINITY_DN596_c0_g1_i2.p1 TRINITY_DN596_c0_g1~~TRINITY_DN596_c0_g1_i2.p1  ORF type:complete len:254 (+),score=15.82 TRINITY_DN596_c0_g1_i2:586-1347(+)